MQKFFTETFDGVLIIAFRVAYDSVDAADRHKGLPHLPRELEKVDLCNDSAPWQAFAKKLRRLLRDQRLVQLLPINRSAIPPR